MGTLLPAEGKVGSNNGIRLVGYMRMAGNPCRRWLPRWHYDRSLDPTESSQLRSRAVAWNAALLGHHRCRCFHKHGNEQRTTENRSIHLGSACSGLFRRSHTRGIRTCQPPDSVRIVILTVYRWLLLRRLPTTFLLNSPMGVHGHLKAYRSLWVWWATFLQCLVRWLSQRASGGKQYLTA